MLDRAECLSSLPDLFSLQRMPWSKKNVSETEISCKPYWFYFKEISRLPRPESKPYLASRQPLLISLSLKDQKSADSVRRQLSDHRKKTDCVLKPVFTSRKISEDLKVAKRKPLGPGQTINVWRPNTIKHCLVTKHANVEVSGQTIKTRLIKHRSNNWYKPLSKRGTHERFKHVWYAAVQTKKRSPIKHEHKRNVLSCCLNVWWPSNFIKHDRTRSNTYKHDQTAPNKVSKR